MDLLLTTEQKQRVILSPKTAAGNPAQVDGAPTWAVISGNGTVDVAADGLSAFIVSTDTVDGIPTVYSVTADADLGSGVENIVDTITLTTKNANAAALGLSTEPPIAK
jgi:hypothetical protein